MNPSFFNNNDTICALSTPAGSGAIGIVRLSGPEAISICDSLFQPKNAGFRLEKSGSHTVHFGRIHDGETLIDEVLVSVFLQPHSYTGQNIVEISCHGSVYIQRRIIELLLTHGARLAEPGEFTLRAFMNGKFDLSQAEAVADLIASTSEASHRLAINQMRGGFSLKIGELRARLIDFASLIELELDFSEEDVEFADRTALRGLLTTIKAEIESLKSSFALGNVMKHGIPVAIAGKPNVGKSTLLNALLNEERALVSEIPGTTRDAIEDTINIQGITFRFIDTAGLRHTDDTVENMGIERTFDKMNQASVVLYVFDITSTTEKEIDAAIAEIREQLEDSEKQIIPVANKTDMLMEAPHSFKKLVELDTLFISAKRSENINLIVERLLKTAHTGETNDQTIVYSLRHFEALSRAAQSIESIEQGFAEGVPSDLIAIDIRQALHHLGSITGEVTTNEILGNIFGKFCIGK
ncbi:MAG: tRNA uridine-5-carboxymethylaminomethyl(34) synthesis GTPase MnmE [Lentimicrobiaceae bacterium]|nr:tRNA uridine-5-carboxymethylaminomethyl(34) synthesis GTPase MnmE [Lentimicrobiaceae bacterium]